MRLTLDIGGSKTRGFLYADNAEEKIEIRGSFGTAEDSKDVEPELFSSLKDVLGDRLAKITAIAVNLGGKNKEQILRTVTELCPHARIRIQRESEGILAQRIMRTNGVNVLIMAGTGCIVFSESEQGYRVLGGWGKDYGDEGSGYSLGIKAVRYALKELDSGAEKTSLLTKALFGAEAPFRFHSIDEYAAARDEARNRIPKTRQGIAALAKTVVNCAEQGCTLSKRILSELGTELAELCLAAVKADAIEAPSVAINGGVTNFYALWKDAFLEKLKIMGKKVNVVCFNDGIDKALKQIVEEM